MPRFNDFFYGLTGPGTGYYGTRAPLAFSALPMTATAVGYDEIALTWSSPSAGADEDYSKFRVVRNQNGFPQTESDGNIVYETDGHPQAYTQSSPFKDTSVDSTTGLLKFPLMGGRFVFYRAWVRKDTDGAWVQAGDAYTLIPSPHNLGIGRDSKYVETNSNAAGYIGKDRLAFFDPNTSPFVSSTHQRFLDIFPRTITSKSTSSLDVPNNSYQGKVYQTEGGLGPLAIPDNTADQFTDENALFPAFMSAFSFTLDEMLTFASLITPNISAHWSSPTSVFLGSQELGMTVDLDPVTSTQRRLLRNAVPIYQKKGSSSGLELYCQSLTGYDAQISETSNLLLSIEDSTFYLPSWETAAKEADDKSTSRPSVGNWLSGSTGLKIEVVSDQVGTTNPAITDAETGRYVIDRTYAAKVTPSSTNQTLSLGVVSPIGTGIPVKSGSYYVFSGYYKTASTSNSITVETRWFDKKGLYISSTTSSALSLSTGSWSRLQTSAALAPDNAVYMGVSLKFATSGVVYLDLIQFEKVDTSETTASNYQEPRGAKIYLAPLIGETTYPAKSARLQRLQKEIGDYISFGTPFFVTLSDDPMYYKGIA